EPLPTSSSSGSSSSGSGSSSGGDSAAPTPTTTTTPTAAPTPSGTETPPPQFAAPTAGPVKSAEASHAGAISVGSGSETVKVAWGKGGPGDGVQTVSVASSSFVIPDSGGAPATASAVILTANAKGGHAVTVFASPLDLSFAGAAGNVTPAF